MSFSVWAERADSGADRARDIFSDIGGWFGRGRREADIIVPVQEQFGRFLENANNAIRSPDTTVVRLRELGAELAQWWGEFDSFTRDTRFTDGRASVQARNTIRPLVDGRDDAGNLIKSDGGTFGAIERALLARGVGPANSGNTSGGSGLGIAAAIAALFAFVR